MGLHVPGLGVRFNRDQPAGVQGNIGFVSQSGTHGMNFSLTGAAHGLYCSTLVSFGNGIILEAADYLEYLADDPQTEVIGMYIEGARDGRRLFKTLREVAAKKPVIIWKGGQTEGGGRAIRSHTASLASDQAIWEAMIQQVGAVAVHNLDEMIDVVKATLLTKRTQGNRLGLIAMTGGQSVVLTDAFEKAGWKVPTLSDDSYAQLSEFFNIIGGSYRNPLDAAGTIGQDPKHLDTIFDILNAGREHRRRRHGTQRHVHGPPLAGQTRRVRPPDQQHQAFPRRERKAVPRRPPPQPRRRSRPHRQNEAPGRRNPHLPQLRTSGERIEEGVDVGGGVEDSSILCGLILDQRRTSLNGDDSHDHRVSAGICKP